MRLTYPPAASTRTRVIGLLCATCFILGGCRAREDASSDPSMLSGKWMAEYVDASGMEWDAELVFRDGNQFTLGGMSRIPNSDLDYPLPIWTYEYDLDGEDQWSLTMIAKLAEGKDVMTPNEGRPGQSTLRRVSETELILETPTRTMHFHPIKP